MKIDGQEQRQAILAAIVEESEYAIISKDLSSTVMSWNKSAERIFGYTEAEMVGSSIYKIIPPDRLNEEEEIIATVKKGQRMALFETVRLTKNGRKVFISLTVSPIRNDAGSIIGIAKIARDITLQKQYEDRLQIINDLGKSVNAQLDESSILQIVTDATTRLSTAAFGAFFYNKIDNTGDSYMLYALSGADREQFDKLGMPRNTGVFKTTFSGTGIVRSKDISKDPRYGKNAPHHGMPKGHLPVVSYLAVPVISRSGQVMGGLFFGHPEPDIFTKEHEELVVAIASQASIALDNARMYQEVSMLNNKKDQFISFASHELKTPLTTLKGYLQLAEKMEMKVSEIYPKVNKQVSRLEEIITELLDISRISAGKFELQMKGASLEKIVKESMDAVFTDSHVFEVEKLQEDVEVMVDRGQIIHVLVNLLSNAIKYSIKGSKVLLRCTVLGNDVTIIVKDEGVGIPEQHMEHVFNQFYRVYHPESKVKGMGLGLFIAKEIIEAHAGRIWVESEVGKGSTFFISFPMQQRVRR